MMDLQDTRRDNASMDQVHKLMKSQVKFLTCEITIEVKNAT